jgi:hypothetical protein
MISFVTVGQTLECSPLTYAFRKTTRPQARINLGEVPKMKKWVFVESSGRFLGWMSDKAVHCLEILHLAGLGIWHQ